VLAGSAGIVGLYFGGRDSLWKHHLGLQALLNSVGGLLVASVALGLIWELAGKRAFAKEVLASATAGADIDTMGVVRMTNNYAEADWADLFAGVQKLDIFVAYARTWRNSHIDRLRKLARTPGVRIRVFLPDSADAETVRWMAERFGYTSADLCSAIEEAKQAYTSLATANGSTVEVYYRKGESLFSCYRFDTTAVITLYTHRRERTGVPTLVCRDGGQLYEFVRGELAAIESQSLRVYP
jgi:hypothetical protein